MKNPHSTIRYILPLLGLLVFVGRAESQDERGRWHERPGLTMKVIGTGRTTGHIIWFFSINEGSHTLELEIPSLLVPSANGHQGYAVPEPTLVSIPPGATVEVPLRGYCTDPDLPAVPPGGTLPPISTWLTDALILQQLRAAGGVLTDLQREGSIHSPFHGDPVLERDLILQQLTWVLGAPDGTYDPCTRIRRALEQTFRDTEGYANRTAEVEEGIAQIADALRRVGRTTGLSGFGMEPITDLPLTPSPDPAPGSQDFLRAKGTGRTTGHIADFYYRNTTRESLTILLGEGGPLYIPSSGKDQPYVIPDPPLINLAPGQERSVPVYGYCVDIHRPPVADGVAMPSVSKWVSTVRTPTSIPTIPAGHRLVQVPVRMAPSIEEVTGVLSRLPPPPIMAGWDCPEPIISDYPLIPGTVIPVRFPLRSETDPGAAVPILIEALDRIMQATDRLYDREAIDTPFRNDRDREREAVIQQTFWMYTARLRDEPYWREDFLDRTRDQFETTTGRSFESLPPEQQKQLDKGVDDFWNTFQAVGVEAKVLPTRPPVTPDTGIREFFSDPALGNGKPTPGMGRE